MLLCKTSNLFDTSFSALSLTISVFGPKQFSYCLKKKSLFFFLKLCFPPLRDEKKKKKTTHNHFYRSTDLRVLGHILENAQKFLFQRLLFFMCCKY